MSLYLRRCLCPCISGDVYVTVSPEISVSLYLRRYLCPHCPCISRDIYVPVSPETSIFLLCRRGGRGPGARVSGRTLGRAAGLVHGSGSENGLVSRARPGTPFPGRSSMMRRARRVNESPRLAEGEPPNAAGGVESLASWLKTSLRLAAQG